jgi:hypothetical protein
MRVTIYAVAYRRFEDFSRETGTLLVAFAPLEAILGSGNVKWGWMLFFIASGIVFILLSIALEFWRRNGP